MNVERLTMMIDLLRADAANPQGVRFDLATWASPADGGIAPGAAWELGEEVVTAARIHGDGYVMGDAKVIPMSCDTFACAFGLAALDPGFRALGLDYRFVPLHHGQSRGAMIPTYDDSDGMGAAAKLFEIEHEDARYFFEPECYRKIPREAEGELLVAQRIEDFINGEIDRDYHPEYRDEEYDNDDDDDDSED